MPVDGVSTGTINYLSTTETKKSMSVDSDTFLKLLVAQLQYQNPLEPQTDTAFVTQLSQMSTMEYLQSMKDSMTSAQAYGMIGNYVYAEVLNSKTGITEAYLGLASSVIIKNGVNYVLVGDTAIPVSKVSRVISPYAFDSTTGTTDTTGTTGTTDTADTASGT